MIIESVFHALVFPWLLYKDQNALVDQWDGLLFPLSVTAKGESTRGHCATAPKGWSVCPAGFATYVVDVPFVPRGRLVIYGLKINGISKSKGKSTQRSVVLDRIEVEKYIDGVFSMARSLLSSFGNVMNVNIHEIRSINRDIMASAQNLIDHIDQGFFDQIMVREQALNTRGLSEILGNRTNFLEYLSSAGIQSFPRSRLRPYGKFDKVRKSLERRTREKRIRLSMSGSSFSEINALDVFEVIPYLMIQNAIKYSPENGDVSIRASEYENTVRFDVQNSGPALDDSEYSKIFELGYRGIRARKFSGVGSGVGLAFLKELVEIHHSGKLTLQQHGPTSSIKGIDFCTITLTAEFQLLRS